MADSIEDIYLHLSVDFTANKMEKCTFSEGWLANPKYKAWLAKDLTFLRIK